MFDGFIHHLAIIMFFVLTLIMFAGYPVAFVLGATGVFLPFLDICGGAYPAGWQRRSRCSARSWPRRPESSAPR
ncbi:MAG: hypothetical protein FJX57_03810 [Alphaproteobacteria bacterium]|nr:hypothetical protein [Alphaproteobacteria bacterium]